MPVLVPVHRLAKVCNPFLTNVWNSEQRLTRRGVAQALLERRLVAEPTSTDHAGRVAYLVENEALDPIDIDVGVPALKCHVNWPVQDGNHRLAASIYANRMFISSIVGGQLDYAKSLFGVDCEEPQLSQSCSGVGPINFIRDDMKWDDLSNEFVLRAWNQKTNDTTALMAFGA